MSRGLALASLVVVTGLTGCGATGSDSSEDLPAGAQRDAAAVIEELQDRALRREATTICTDLLTKELAATIMRTQRTRTCEGGLEPILDDVSATQLDVERVDVTGETATATVRSEAPGDDRRTDRFTLRRVGSVWRIDGLTPPG